MNRSFVCQFLSTYSQTLCGCHQQTMTILQKEINQSQITFKSIQNMLKTIPPDLKIISEDKKEYSSHKLLFGLFSPTLANIFLDDEFISEKVTLFMPINSELLKIMTNEEVLLRNKLEDVFSTSFYCPEERDRDVFKNLHELRSIELIKAERKFEFKDEENQSTEADNANGDLAEEEGEIINPVKIIFKKERKRKKELKSKRKNPIPCEDCGKICRNKSALKIHRKNHHENPENVPCEDCGKIYRNIMALKMHRHNYHRNPENVLQQCDKCSYSTLHRFLLDQHIQTQHNTQQVQCTECGKSFYGQRLYQNHFKRMHTKQELFPCKECGKEFKKHRLQIHIAQMHRERRFACNLCSYKAQSGYNLKLHISKSHLGIKELPKHKCPHCDIETTNLDYHIKSSHKNII